MMGNKEYLINEGNVCPKCGSEDIFSSTEIEDCGLIAFRNCECKKCRFPWEDRFKLIGYVYEKGE